MKKTSVYLPEDLLREVEYAARREGRPQAEIVREALTRYVADNPRPRPGFIGAADGPEDGSSGAKVKRKLRKEYEQHLDKKLARALGTRADS